MYTKLPGLEEVCAFRVLLASGITPDYAGSPECLLNNKNLCGLLVRYFLQVGCHSCHPTNGDHALRGHTMPCTVGDHYICPYTS